MEMITGSTIKYVVVTHLRDGWDLVVFGLCELCRKGTQDERSSAMLRASPSQVARVSGRTVAGEARVQG